MVEEGFLPEAAALAAQQGTLHFSRTADPNPSLAPHLVDMVRKFLYQNYGPDFVLQAGLKIYTTLDPVFQRAALEAVDQGTSTLYSRHLYSKPLRRIPPEQIEAYCRQLTRAAASNPPKNGRPLTGVITQIDPVGRTARVCLGGQKGLFPLPRRSPAPRDGLPDEESAEEPVATGLYGLGDVLNFRLEPGRPYLTLAEQNPVEAALLCIDRSSGAIKALVGGKDYSQTEFNRAVQSKRQPGSSFKPIIYAAALDKDFTPATVIMDAPLVFGGSNPWAPQNFDQKLTTAICNAAVPDEQV